jgi:hypothetical protein
MQMLVLMNASIAVHLGDSLPGAATGKTDLHKSANKEDLAAAKGQGFSNLLLAAQQKVNATTSASPEDLEPHGQDAKADEAKESEPVEEDAQVVTPSVALPTLNAVVAQPLLSPNASTTSVANDVSESPGEVGTEKSKTAPRAEKTGTDSAPTSSDLAPTLQPVQTKEVAEATLLPLSLPNMFPAVKPESAASSEEKGRATTKSEASDSAGVKVVLGASGLDKGASMLDKSEPTSGIAIETCRRRE